MSRQFWRLHRRKRKTRNTAELAAQLAPLEELDKRAAQLQIAPERLEKVVSETQVGSIVVDNSSIQMPKGVVDGQSGGKGLLGIESVVLVILFTMLAFIGFIAWQISRMPE